MSFTKRLTKIQFIVDHLSLPQRIAILGGLLFTIYIPWFFLIYKPQADASLHVQQQINDLQNQTNILSKKYTDILILAKSQDLDKLTAKYKNLQQQLQDLNQQISHFHHRYISDKELAALLHAILDDIDKIRIENFSILVNVPKTLASPPATTPPSAATPTTPSPPAATPTTPAMTGALPNPPEMVHYSLSLRGDYFSIMQFLKRVESIKWQLFWEAFNYQVVKYPEATATVEFYTLKYAPVTPVLIKGVSK